MHFGGACIRNCIGCGIRSTNCSVRYNAAVASLSCVHQHCVCVIRHRDHWHSCSSFFRLTLADPVWPCGAVEWCWSRSFTVCTSCLRMLWGTRLGIRHGCHANHSSATTRLWIITISSWLIWGTRWATTVFDLFIYLASTLGTQKSIKTPLHHYHHHRHRQHHRNSYTCLIV